MRACVRCRAELTSEWIDDGERCACPNGCFSSTVSLDRLEEQVDLTRWWMVSPDEQRSEAEVLAAYAAEVVRGEALVVAFSRNDWPAFERLVQEAVDAATPPPLPHSAPGA